MASRNLTDLHPALQKKAEEFLTRCENAGCPVLIYCTYRPILEQAALYAQGRLTLAEVNRLRIECKLAPLGWSENSRIVTNAKPGQSEHNHVDEENHPAALAFDCCPIDGGKLDWASPHWGTIGGIGVNLGLEWYGSPKARFHEKPHFAFHLT